MILVIQRLQSQRRDAAILRSRLSKWSADILLFPFLVFCSKWRATYGKTLKLKEDSENFDQKSIDAFVQKEQQMDFIYRYSLLLDLLIFMKNIVAFFFKHNLLTADNKIGQDFLGFYVWILL